MKILRNLFACIVIFTSFCLSAQNAKQTKYNGSEKYFELQDGFYGGISWLYLRPTSSDGDLEFGSFLTLTGSPANLNAKLLELDPSYQNSFRINSGYNFVCRNEGINLSYFYFKSKEDQSADIASENQLIQNFLGASYSTSNASARQRVDQVNLSFSKHYIVKNCLNLNPYVGISYADIDRRLKVDFNDLVLNPLPSNLTGNEKSSYWGVGPFTGVNFKYQLFSWLKIKSQITGGLFLGKIKSKVNSESFRFGTFSSFNASHSDFRAVPLVMSDLALVFFLPVRKYNFNLELTAGYEVDYYFKAIDRINPFNGYVNNPNTFPVRQKSNLGLGGPYLLLTLSQTKCLKFSDTCIKYLKQCNCSRCGLYAKFISTWLEPSPTNNDLTYANLETTNGSTQSIKTNPDMTWAQSYDLGFYCANDLDFRASFFYFSSQDSSSKIAGNNQNISSLNASGPGEVRFSSTISQVKYRIYQADLKAGKSICFYNSFNIESLFGLRYLYLKRKQNNEYLGGFPPLTTASKFPILKSRYQGVGPLFGVKPNISIFRCFYLVGQFNVGLLVGKIKATLNQDNQGTLGESSNTLRTLKVDSIVPMIDAKGGLKFSKKIRNHFLFEVEGGYQFTEYYRAVNLLFPTLLTGLEQTNSNLKLTGPYVSAKLNF